MFLGYYFQSIFGTVLNVVTESWLFLFYCLFYMQQSSATFISWNVEPVYIALRMQCIISYHNFPCSSIKFFQLMLCPVYNPCGVPDDRNSPAVNCVEVVATIQFRLQNFADRLMVFRSCPFLHMFVLDIICLENAKVFITSLQAESLNGLFVRLLLLLFLLLFLLLLVLLLLLLL